MKDKTLRDVRLRPKIYLAAPLFNEMERQFNLKLASEIQRHADVFLPQRDGGLMMEFVKAGVAPDSAAKKVFEMDRRAMEDAHLLVAVLDGAGIDEGVAFEIGFMFSLGKYCMGLQTDMRRALPTGNNPMIAAALDVIYGSISELIVGLKQYLVGRLDQGIGVDDCAVSNSNEMFECGDPM